MALSLVLPAGSMNVSPHNLCQRTSGRLVQWFASNGLIVCNLSVPVNIGGAGSRPVDAEGADGRLCGKAVYSLSGSRRGNGRRGSRRLDWGRDRLRSRRFVAVDVMTVLTPVGLVVPQVAAILP